MEPTQQSGPEQAGPSPIKFAVYALVGGLAVYLATWVGPVAFYFNFQKTVAADTEGAEHRRLVWHTPRQVPCVDSEDWTSLVTEGHVGFPLPPGKLVGVEKEGDFHLVRYDEGTFKAQRFPPGFLVFLFLQELEHLGGRIERSLSDVSVMHEVLNEVPGRFEFGWSTHERNVYATRILAKMLIFENEPVKRLEVSTRPSPLRAAALVEFECGKIKIVRADEQGVLVVLLPEDAPKAWSATPGAWLGDLMQRPEE